MPNVVVNKKVTELPVATTIDPTDVLLVVQGGVTKQVSQDAVAAAVAASTQLAATYVTFVKSDGTPVTGKHVVIKLTADQTDILDIQVVTP